MTIREHYNQGGSKDEIEISVSGGIDAERRNFSGGLSRLVCVTINRRQQKFRNKTDAVKKYLESNRNGGQRRYNPCGGRKLSGENVLWVD